MGCTRLCILGAGFVTNVILPGDLSFIIHSLRGFNVMFMSRVQLDGQAQMDSDPSNSSVLRALHSAAPRALKGLWSIVGSTRLMT